MERATLEGLFELLGQQTGPCDHSYRLTCEYFVGRGVPAGDFIEWLGWNGAGCDCEVIFNVEAVWADWAAGR